MRISELASRGGVPVATVKFYLREGLLPAGRLTSATQAQYDEEHLQRLRLVRALLAAGLSLADARRILELVDTPPDQLLDVLAATQGVITPAVAEAEPEPARSLLADWGWCAGPELDAQLCALARALAAASAAGFEVIPEVLVRYAVAMHAVAEAEIDHVPLHSTEEAVRYVVLGSVLMEPVLLALRRLAEADVSLRRFSPPNGET